MRATDDPVGLMVESWCSPTLVSPAGRPCSVLQLEQHQAAGPVDIGNAFLEDKQWDMEAMVISTIAGQLEDEEEEEDLPELLDGVEEGAKSVAIATHATKTVHPEAKTHSEAGRSGSVVLPDAAIRRVRVNVRWRTHPLPLGLFRPT